MDMDIRLESPVVGAVIDLVIATGICALPLRR